MRLKERFEGARSVARAQGARIWNGAPAGGTAGSHGIEPDWLDAFFPPGLSAARADDLFAVAAGVGSPRWRGGRANNPAGARRAWLPLRPGARRRLAQHDHFAGLSSTTARAWV